MSKPSSHKGSLTEAIDKLEKVSLAKADEVKGILEKDYHELLKTVESLKPHLEQLRTQIENEVKSTQTEVEDRMKNNPWMTLGVVGLVAFFLGWVFGRKK